MEMAEVKERLGTDILGETSRRPTPTTCHSFLRDNRRMFDHSNVRISGRMRRSRRLCDIEAKNNGSWACSRNSTPIPNIRKKTPAALLDDEMSRTDEMEAVDVFRLEVVDGRETISEVAKERTVTERTANQIVDRLMGRGDRNDCETPMRTGNAEATSLSKVEVTIGETTDETTTKPTKVEDKANEKVGLMISNNEIKVDRRISRDETDKTTVVETKADGRRIDVMKDVEKRVVGTAIAERTANEKEIVEEKIGETTEIRRTSQTGRGDRETTIGDGEAVGRRTEIPKRVVGQLIRRVDADVRPDTDPALGVVDLSRITTDDVTRGDDSGPSQNIRCRICSRRPIRIHSCRGWGTCGSTFAACQCHWKRSERGTRLPPGWTRTPTGN